MGSNKITHSNPNMTKFSLVVAISLAVAATASQFESESSAKTVIRSKRWSTKGTPALKKHDNGVYQDCPMPGHKMCDKTGEYWEDIKDHFEGSCGPQKLTLTNWRTVCQSVRK